MSKEEKPWQRYKVTLIKIIDNLENTETMHFWGLYVEEVYKTVDFYLRDYLSVEDRGTDYPIWIRKLVNTDNPLDRLSTERPDSWPVADQAATG